MRRLHAGGAREVWKVPLVHGRSAALSIMPLALWLTLGTQAQMTAVAAVAPESSSSGGPGASPELYSSSGAAAPSMPGPAEPFTLPPPPKRVRALPDARSGDRVRPFHAAAFGVTASTLGGGAEMAVPIARKLNLRVGGSYLNWRFPFSKDAIDYSPGVKFAAGREPLTGFRTGAGFM